ncbi:MAG: hypothetical protein RIR18_1747 [Pseudomonadota bacterium]|jgi:glycosyltransferase involved in cell wall biosynthesis
MKIAFIDVTVTSSYGGIQTAIWSLSKVLYDMGHEITIIGGHGNIRPDLGGREITVQTFDYTSREKALDFGNRFRRFWERWTFARNARSAVIQAGFDWVIVTKPYDFFWPSIMPSNSKTKFAFRSGGTSFILGDRYFAKRISAFFANSYFNAWQIKERFGVFPKVIYNGVDLVRFGPHKRSLNIREKLGLGDDALLCIYAGRLVGWKGISHTIKALNNPLIQSKPIHLVIIGSGPEEEKLKKLTQQENLAGKVTFMPSMPHDDLPCWWASADIGVFASISDEGFSNSIAEALASGLPVIATAFSGNPETVGNENTCGLLIPPEDTAAIAQAINQLFTDPKTREAMGIAARKRIEDNFTWEKVASRLVDGLKKISNTA